MLDVVLGTVDRECLEGYDMRPERQLWWDCGMEWVQKISERGLDVPVHPRFKVDEAVEGRTA